MSLVLRRAHAARSLLLAAAAVALIATTLLTSLAAYSREVAAGGARGVVAAAAPDERAVLVRGSVGSTADDLVKRDAVLRAQRLAGRPVAVSAAGFASGKELTGRTGRATPDTSGAVYGAVAFLEGLDQHADLSAGAWPRPGADVTETVLPESAAAVLQLKIGDRVPVYDRVKSRATALRVVGIWRPRDLRDPYWVLTPEVASGAAPGTATYGPFVVDRADFTGRFFTNASAGWLIEPELSSAGPADIAELAEDARTLTTALPAAAGLGTSGLVNTRLGELADRLLRADLVGRSALVTPMLLIGIVSGLALMLVAALLVDHRRGESALLRARGAARIQLAGLATREALLVVAPAALLAPPLAAAAITVATSTLDLPIAAPAGIWPDGLFWLVAAGAALGCAVAIVLPSLRGGGTYVAELAGQSRPPRRTVVQRIGLDLALVGLSVLGWFQLRQYASPVGAGHNGALGIDPFLAATPTLGVLAGATLALRLLSPTARSIERRLDRGARVGGMLGMWQAGRRPHAGPVLLLALAVAAGTVAWGLAGTSARSAADQADHFIGADLRVQETDGLAPQGRKEQLAALPGAGTVLPVLRSELPKGPLGEEAELLALDTAAAPGIYQVRPDLAGGDTRGPLADLSSRRAPEKGAAVPAGATRLTGKLVASARDDIRTEAVFTAADGDVLRVDLGGAGRFAVDLPRTTGPLRLSGFAVVLTAGRPEASWAVSGLSTDRGALALDGPSWRVVGAGSVRTGAAVSGGTLTATLKKIIAFGSPLSFLVGVSDVTRVPVWATPQAASVLALAKDAPTVLRIEGVDVPVEVVGTIAAVPGSADSAALLADLPTLSSALLGAGATPQPREWLVASGADTHARTAEAAAGLGNIDVLDRRELASSASRDAYGVGARTTLFIAALGAVLLAIVGIVVDVRTTARRRITELAVLHTLGAGSRLLARSLMVEQAFLAGVGVLAGLVVGMGVAATTVPLLILTPAGGRPVPSPVLELGWWQSGAVAVLLLALAVGLSAAAGSALPRRLAVAQLRIGADR
ncbi:FtsX-like permease family protein [Actinoplanes sp. NPDC051859]|uniref:ABC transporter permease n=1 Tax=Actinoplanes sp. NPDC051859 TaxID=3363909 RepID=UPI0037AAFCBC